MTSATINSNQKLSCGIVHSGGALTWMSILLMPVCFWLTGCAPGEQKPIPEKLSSTTDLQTDKDYGNISPRTLDENLTEQQLARMFVPLEDVPDVPLWDEDEPNQPQHQISSASPDKVLARKAYLRGRWLLVKGQYTQALEQITEGLQAEPNNAALYELLAKVNYNKADLTAASAAARNAVMLNSDSLSAYQILGSWSMKLARFPRAAAFFRKALASPQATRNKPATSVLHLQLAQTLERMDYTAAAADQYHQAYKLLHRQSNSNQASPLLINLVQQRHIPLLKSASLQIRMGRIDQAVKLINTVQQSLRPEMNLMSTLALSLAGQRAALQLRYRQVWYLCRYLLTLDYQVEQTLNTFHRACKSLAKERDYPDVLADWFKPESGKEPLLTAREYAYGLSLAGLDDQALEVLHTHLNRTDDKGLVHAYMARLYKRKQQWRDMIFHYGGFLQDQPHQSPTILSELDQVFSQIPQLAEKLEQWQSDEALVAGFGNSFLLGYLAQSINLEDLAENYYRRSLAAKPDFDDGRRHFIDLLLRQGKGEQVLSWISQNGTALQDDPQMLWYAGRAHMELGRLHEAGQYYQRIMELRKDDIRACAALAEVLVRQNAFSQAERMLLELAADWPGRQEVVIQLLMLYTRWNAQEDISEKFRTASQKRARLMLTRLFRRDDAEGSSSESNQLLQQLRQRIQILLEDLVREYPQARAAGLMLGELYYSQGRLDEAIHAIEAVLVHHPHNRQVLIQAAKLHEKDKNLERAGQLRLQLWREHQDDPQLLLKVLITMQRSGRVPEALKLLLETAQSREHQNLKTVKLLQRQALRLFNITRQYHDAVELFQKWYWLVLTTPDDQLQSPQDQKFAQLTNAQLVWALTEAGYYDRAIQHALALQQRYAPSEPVAALYLVRTLNIRRMYDQSRALLEELMYIQPDNLALRLNLCITMIENSQPNKAIASARKWVQEKPLEKSRRRMLLFILRQAGKYQQAIVFLRDYVEQLGGDLDEVKEWRLELADVLLAAGEVEEAEKVLQKTTKQVKFLPGSGRFSPKWYEIRMKIDMFRGRCEEAMSHLAEFAQGAPTSEVERSQVQILLDCGETEQAEEMIRKIIAEEPAEEPEKEIGIGMLHSVALERLGRADEAIAKLDGLLEKYASDPAIPSIKNNLGYVLVQTHKQVERAQQLLQESLEAEPESSPTLDSMGWFYYKKGDFEKALEYIYRAAAKMSINDPEMLNHLGDVHYRLGQRDEARGYWQKCQVEYQRRVPTKRFLKVELDKVEEKLRQLSAGEEVTVVELFEQDE